MKIIKKYKIGSVNLTQLEGADIDSSRYSDGDSEKTLYDIFTSANPKGKIDNILQDEPEWPIYYHLSPYRKNVIDWYEFKAGSSVLEIGAGCGAVTEALCSKPVDVTALELTKRRAEINAYRNKKSENLEMYIGNLEEYEPSKKFDYIVCVGVLEYAGIFIDSDEPYDEFLRLLSGFLKDDGKLIIAIENRLGLKYLSGSREDHTGRFYDGINQYPHPKKVQTFGKKELSKLIASNGFEGTEFFYPYPDYKNPQIVYSDNYHPGLNTDFPVKLLPTASHDAKNRNRVHIFSEQLAMLSVEKNLLYPDLANSFVVVAHKNNLNKESLAYYTNTPGRKEKYQINTYLEKKDDAYAFYKEASSDESIEHINKIYDNYAKLSTIFEDSKIKIVKADKVSERKLAFKLVPGVTLERKLFEFLVTQNFEQADKIISDYIKAVELLPGKETTDQFLVDLNFDNIIVDKKGTWHFIDYEWLLDKKVDKKVIVQRSLFYFINRHSDAFTYLLKRGGYLRIANGWYFPSVLYEKYFQYFESNDNFVQHEIKFLSMVNKTFSGHPVIDKTLLETPEEPEDEPGFVENHIIQKHENHKLKEQLQLSQKKIEDLTTDLNQQMTQRRKAELTSVYYLPKKISGKLKRYISKKG